MLIPFAMLGPLAEGGLGLQLERDRESGFILLDWRSNVPLVMGLRECPTPLPPTIPPGRSS